MGTKIHLDEKEIIEAIAQYISRDGYSIKTSTITNDKDITLCHHEADRAKGVYVYDAYIEVVPK